MLPGKVISIVRKANPEKYQNKIFNFFTRVHDLGTYKEALFKILVTV